MVNKKKIEIFTLSTLRLRPHPRNLHYVKLILRKIMNIYVGNIPFAATQDSLQKVFEAHGDVTSVFLPTDRESGRPRGFGFVEMDDEGGKKAIAELDGFEMEGRNLRVNEARPKEERR